MIKKFQSMLRGLLNFKKNIVTDLVVLLSVSGMLFYVDDLIYEYRISFFKYLDANCVFCNFTTLNLLYAIIFSIF